MKFSLVYFKGNKLPVISEFEGTEEEFKNLLKYGITLKKEIV